uniref:Macro domain-containing protein n=1 Tax=Scleropages formosus TaxID=113540 RepID=A0A8C9QT89_SCLFO
MEDHPFPVVVEGDWEQNTNKVKKKLQIYFQSPKNSGGGECVVEFDTSGNKAIVWFKSDVRENILQRKNHVVNIDSKDVNLRVSIAELPEGATDSHVGELFRKHESGVEKVQNSLQAKTEEIHITNIILLENLKSIEKDILVMMVKEISKDEFSAELHKNIKKAIVSFSNTDDATQFLVDCSSNKKFLQYGLSARPLEQTRSVRVENLPSNTTEGLLKSSFERAKSGGGPVEAIKMIPEEQAAIITFIDPQVLETLQNNRQYVCEVPINVYPYYDSIGMALSVAKGTTVTTGVATGAERLKPVEEEVLQTTTRQFEMEKECVSEEIYLEPTMFYILEQGGIKQGTTGKFPEPKLTYIPDVQKLVIFGLPNEVSAIKHDIQLKINKIKQTSVDVDVTLLSFLSEVDNKKMSLQMFSSCKINALYKIVSGAVFIVASCDQTLAKAETRLKKVLMTQHMNVQDPEILKKPEWLKFKAELVEAYNSACKTVTINYVTESTLVICGLSKQVMAVCERVSDFINKNTHVEEFVPVQCNTVLEFIQVFESQAWQKYNSNNGVKILFENNGPHVKLSGGSLLVQELKSLFHKLADPLFTDCLRICNPGARKHFLEKQNLLTTFLIKHYNCVVMLEDNKLEVGGEEAKKNTAEQEDKDVQWTCKVKMPNGEVIVVGKANLCRVAVDAVVNAANGHLRHTGGLAGALVFAAGPQLQDDSDQYIKKNGPLRTGQAIATAAGQLPCRIIIHAVGPRYRETDNATAVRLLKRAVLENLIVAVKNNSSTIAIPAISSGIFGFPLNLCAETIAKTVREHCEKPPEGRGTLSKIYLLNHDDKTVQAMTTAVMKVFEDMQMQLPAQWNQPKSNASSNKQKYAQGRKNLNNSDIVGKEKTESIQGAASIEADVAQTPQESPAFFSFISIPSPGRYMMQIGQITFKVLSEGNVEEVTDAVVIFSSNAFTPKSGALPNCGIAVTQSGHLPLVIHVCIENNTNDIKKKILDALLKCEENKCTSARFPAVDTSMGGLPPSSVPDAFLGAVAEFQMKRKGRHLQAVNVAVFHSDMVVDFYKSMKAREAQPCTALQKSSWFSNPFSGVAGRICNLYNAFLGTSGVTNEASSRRHGEEADKGFTLDRGKDIESEPKTRKFDLSVYQSVGKNFTPVVFQFCGQSAEDVARAKEEFYNIIKGELRECTIEHQCIAKISAEDFVKLNDLERKLTVKILLEKHPKPLFHLEGLTQDVLTAEEEITGIINDIILAEKA